MKIDLDALILDLHGKPLPNGGDASMTLGETIATAMIAIAPDDQSLSGDEKMRMFRLAQLAVKGGAQDIKTEDLAMLKTRVGKMYGPLIVGRVYDLIEDK
jgi:hypothetical protein